MRFLIPIVLFSAFLISPAQAGLTGLYTGDSVSGDTSIVNIEGALGDTAKANPPLFPGWPITIAGYSTFAPNDNPTLADLDNDGDLEILVGSPSGDVYVWTYDGNPFPGWPKSATPNCQSGPAVGDIDGDNDIDISVHTRGLTNGGRIHAWETDGTVKTGFPVNVGNWNPSESVSFRDMDGDDALDLIAGFRDYPQAQLYIIEGDGSLWGDYPVLLDHVPSSTAATGDLDDDGQLEFVYSSYYSLYAFEADGTVMAGWPFTPGGDYKFNYSSAVLHDFDDDGDLEICCPADTLGGNARMYVFHHDGTIANGWPITLNHAHCYGSPSLGDVDDDNEIEIVIGDDNISVAQDYATLYCWNFDGSNVAGWPVNVPNSWQIVCNPIIADLDGDGYVEITATSNLYETGSGEGWYHGYNHDGTPMADWPIRVEGWSAYNGGAVGDADDDGDIDLCMLSHVDNDIYVYLWDLDATWDPDLAHWPTYHHDNWHTGEFGLDISTGIDDENGDNPNNPVGFELYQSYPNPAIGSATISFSLPETADVKLIVYDIKGRKISTLVDETLTEGEYERSISGLTSGLYLYRLEASDYVAIKKMVVK